MQIILSYSLNVGQKRSDVLYGWKREYNTLQSLNVDLFINMLMLPTVNHVSPADIING